MRSLLLILLACLFFGSVVFALNKQRDCKCRIGIKRINPNNMPNRIIGGNDAAPMAYPWQVSILHKEKNPVPDGQRTKVPDKEKTKYHTCGGAIINEDWILTAAHCLNPSTRISSVIGYGENDLAQIYNKKKYSKIRRVFIHPNFERDPLMNDVGLIELEQPLQLDGQSVQPACLGFDNIQLYEGALKVSGWGSIVPVFMDKQTGHKTNSSISRLLKEADVNDNSNASTCDRKHFICLKNDRTQDSICHGDSGGPIHYTKSGKSSVVGVASLVNYADQGSKWKICAGESTYTRLSSVEAWVKQQMREAPLPYEYRVKSSDYCS